jgi:PAS domain S-box-containing protein
MRTLTRLHAYAALIVSLTVIASGLYWRSVLVSDALLREDTLAQAERRAAQLTESVAEQMSVLVRSVDMFVLDLRSEYLPGHHYEFERATRTILESFPAESLLGITVVDAKGYLAYSTLGMQERVYLGDREHFKAQLASGQDRLFISKPVIGRVSNTWSIQLSRPIARLGPFAGELVFHLSPEYIERSLAALDLGTNGMAQLLRLDGVFLARTPRMMDALGKALSGSRPPLAENAPAQGVYRGASGADGSPRIYAWRRLRDYPLIVEIGFGEEAILAPVAASIAGAHQRNGAWTALLLLFGAGIAYLLLREARRQRALSESQKKLQIIVDTALDAVIRMDADGIIIGWNAQAEQIFGWPRGEALGRLLHETIIPPESRAAHVRGLRHFLETGEGPALNRRMELSAWHRDGHRFPVELAIAPVKTQGRYEFSAFIRDITERKAAEEDLRGSEARFRSLTGMSSDFYWETDAEHRFKQRDASHDDGALSLLEHGSPIGKRRWELAYFSPDESGWQAHRATLDAQRPFRDFEFSRPGIDGDELHYSTSGDPVFDASAGFQGYRGIGTNITRRKREERLLRLEHAVARSLAAASDESAALKMVMRSICDTMHWGSGIYWHVDQAAGVLRFEEFWNVPGSEFERYAENSRDVTFAPGSGIVGRVWQSGEPLWIADFYNDPRVVQKALARATGMHSVFAFPVATAGRTAGVLAFFSREARQPDERLLAATRMIGIEVGQFLQRMQAEDQVRKLNVELEARVASRTQQLELVNRELEAFSYSVSHDLRAPLRAIHGFSRLVEQQYAGQLDEPGRDMLRRVGAGAQKMAQLIDDLLELSRISRQAMQSKPVDLCALAWEVVGELQIEAPERKVEWVIAPQVTAVGDPGLLRVVLQNLLGNAWKYSSRRELARIEFGVGEKDGRPVYFVRDNGAGFDMAYAHKLFGAFQRLHSAAEFPGSGIGLATVARAIHRHGGDVWAEGGMGEGATFHFSLASEPAGPDG